MKESSLESKAIPDFPVRRWQQRGAKQESNVQGEVSHRPNRARERVYKDERK
jgi:hypothetical protein